MNVILTGVTGEFGNNICNELLEAGIDVFGFFHSRSKEASDLLKKSKHKQGKLILIKGDLTDPIFIKKSFSEIVKDNTIDVLINNAGVNSDHLYLNMSKKEWESVIRINLLSNILLSSLFMKQVAKNDKHALIINIASVSSAYGREGQTNYSFSKGGVIGLSKLISSNNKNISVINIAPGMIKSKMVEKVPESSLNTFLTFTSNKHLGNPNDVSELVKILILTRPQYLENLTLKLDGGFLR